MMFKNYNLLVLFWRVNVGRSTFLIDAAIIIPFYVLSKLNYISYLQIELFYALGYTEKLVRVWFVSDKYCQSKKNSG